MRVKALGLGLGLAAFLATIVPCVGARGLRLRSWLAGDGKLSFYVKPSRAKWRRGDVSKMLSKTPRL